MDLSFLHGQLSGGIYIADPSMKQITNSSSIVICNTL